MEHKTFNVIEWFLDHSNALKSLENKTGTKWQRYVNTIDINWSNELMKISEI